MADRPRRAPLALWLALVFGALAAMSVVLATQIVQTRSAAALRDRAEDVAAGRSFQAAQTVRQQLDRGASLDEALTRAERQQDLTAVVLDERGEPIAALNGPRRALVANPSTAAALEALSSRDRYIDPDAGALIEVALRLRAPDGAVMVTGVSRSSLSTELAIVSHARRDALLVALPISVLVGICVALLLAARVRRIAKAAHLVEQGDLGQALTPGFPDEIGQLAQSFDRMRIRLDESFRTLKADRARLQLLLSRLQQGVIGVTDEMWISYANAAAARITGIPDLAAGDRLPEVWSQLSLNELAANLFLEGAFVDRRRASVDGDREIEVVGIPPGPHGAEAVAVLVITDLSVEARYERAERDFVANAAHELRTPLSTIIGAVDVLLSDDTTDAADRTRFLRHIRREGLRLNRLAHALLILARAQAGVQLQSGVRTPLEPILDAACESVEPAPGVVLSVRCAPDLVTIGDPGLIEQACFNLVANAAAHTESGTITVEATAVGAGCRISVTDTGRGIAPEERERIFERFYRGGEAAHDGFGLGLSIARSCAGALGGTLEIASAPGVGTVAVIELPGGTLEPSALASPRLGVPEVGATGTDPA